MNDFGIWLDGEGDTVIGKLEINGYELVTVKNFYINENLSDKLTFSRDKPLPSESYDLIPIETCSICKGRGIVQETHEESINYGEGFTLSFRIAGESKLCPNCKKVKMN
jgi:hypothetical protein